MRRVVVTGMGLVSPLGDSVETFWNALMTGTSGIRGLSKLPIGQYKGNMLSAEVKWTPDEYKNKLSCYSNAIQYAVRAAKSSIQDAGLFVEAEQANNYSVIVGTTSGNQDMLERTLDTFDIVEENQTFSQEAANMFAHVRPIELSSIVAQECGFGGQNMVISTACAAGNYAIGTAFSMIQDGRTPVVVAGGADAFTRSCYTIFYRLGGMTQEDCRPFDKDRTGMVVGEGAGMLVLEDLEHALQRGAKIYCEVKGYSLTCDAYHRVAPDPEGKGASSAIFKALTHSGLTIDDIDLISAHGTGTPANDSQEVNALMNVFGRKLEQIPISGLKSMLGHCMGAASALEAIASILSLNEQAVPPTINTTEIDPNFPVAVDVIPNQSRMTPVQHVISNAFGFGGNICSIVLSRFNPN